MARARQSLCGQLCREHAGSNRCRGRAALPHRELTDPRDAERDARRDRDGDRVPHGRTIESEDLAGAARRPDGGEHALIPALEGDPVGHATERFVRDRDRGDHRSAVGLARVGGRQHGGNHVTRVAGSARGVGVVAVQVADENGVHEGRLICRRRRARAKDSHRRVPPHAGRDTSRDRRRLAVERAGRASQGVDQSALHLVHCLGREVVERQTTRVVAQELGRRIHENPPRHDGRHCTTRGVDAAGRPR